MTERGTRGCGMGDGGVGNAGVGHMDVCRRATMLRASGRVTAIGSGWASGSLAQWHRSFQRLQALPSQGTPARREGQ